MKNIYFFLLLFTTPFVNAQSPFNFKKDMVWIESAQLYVCKYEVTNAEYRAFTDQLSKDSASMKYFPDTMLWVKEFQNHMGDPMLEYYHKHPAFNGYPVVGVPYKGAVLYCEWLTKKYGEGKYTFRLPTSTEYLSYAKVDTFSVAGGLENVRKKEDGTYLLNYKPGYTSIDGDSVYIYYNSTKNAFFRFITNDIPFDRSYDYIKNGYIWKLESYWNGHLYFTHYKKAHKKIKVKLQDSITFYNSHTDLYTKEKNHIYHNPRSYYRDGYMYTNASRIYKNSEPKKFDDIGTTKKKITPIYNKSTYPADKNGLYDLAGNVSEMVAAEGVAMSGNWNSGPEECTYDYIHPYNRASILVGFRIVAEPVK